MSFLGDAKGRVVAFFRGDPNLKKLKKRGLRVGANFNMLGGCIIDHSHSCLVSIGDDVTFAPRVHVLAHDASTKKDLGYTRIALTDIGNRVFVGAGSIVMPGVSIGDDSIIGAGSVVTRDIPAGQVAVGNPAKVICSKESYLDKQRAEMERLPVFERKYTLGGGCTPELREEMVHALRAAGGRGFIR